MALNQINTYSNVGNASIDNNMLTQNKLMIGHDKLTLTNMDNTTVSAIEQGSIIEIGGALFQATANESISITDPHTSSTVANGTVYIFINGTTGLAYYTATAPTWSDDKQGWYGTSTYANYRYFQNINIVKDSASYIKYERSWKRGNLVNIGASVRLSTDQNITSSGATKIEFDTEDYDYGSCFNVSTNRYTARYAGLYLVTCSVYMEPITDSLGFMDIYVNGSANATFFTYSGGADDFVIHKGAKVLDLSVNDYLELYAHTITDNNYYVRTDIGAHAGIDVTFFTITKLNNMINI